MRFPSEQFVTLAEARRMGQRAFTRGVLLGILLAAASGVLIGIGLSH